MERKVSTPVPLEPVEAPASMVEGLPVHAKTRNPIAARPATRVKVFMSNPFRDKLSRDFVRPTAGCRDGKLAGIDAAHVADRVIVIRWTTRNTTAGLVHRRGRCLAPQRGATQHATAGWHRRI